MKPLPNAFSSYELTEMEELTGSVFSPEQTAVLRNHLSQASLAKLGLIYDPSKPLEFAQQNAFQEGRISLLTYLLEISDSSSESLKTLRSQQPNPDTNQVF